MAKSYETDADYEVPISKVTSKKTKGAFTKVSSKARKDKCNEKGDDYYEQPLDKMDARYNNRSETALGESHYANIPSTSKVHKKY